MLKGIDPLLTADILYVLQSMGHGDEVVIVDTNFIAETAARETTFGEVLHMDGVPAARAARALLSVLPLDTFVDQPVARMEVVGNPAEVLPVMSEVQAEVERAEGRPNLMRSLERFKFYEAAKQSFCIIMTGERRFYGNFIFKKGVIGPGAG
jgi:L-fucose mutarotase